MFAQRTDVLWCARRNELLCKKLGAPSSDTAIRGFHLVEPQLWSAVHGKHL